MGHWIDFDWKPISEANASRSAKDTWITSNGCTICASEKIEIKLKAIQLIEQTNFNQYQP